MRKLKTEKDMLDGIFEDGRFYLGFDKSFKKSFDFNLKAIEKNGSVLFF